MEDQIQSIIALTQIKGIGAVKAKAILQQYGSVPTFFSLCKVHSKEVPSSLQQICDNKSIDLALRWAEKQLNYSQKHNTQIITYRDQTYPYRLKHIDDSPLVLYTKGHLNLNSQRTLGIVGTRKMTSYGKWNIQKIIQDIVGRDIQVISGLAYGVDTMAHRSCVEFQIPTIGVMATGLDIIYPSVNKLLAHKMLDNGGLVTEQGIETKPESYHFPARNRIIAGLSDALLVVESKIKGGAMITADLGFHYNKEIFAIPGRSSDTYSSGTNSLIKENKAQLMTVAKDLLEVMGWDDTRKNIPIQTSLFHDLSPMEKSILETYNKSRPFHIEEILAQWPKSNSEIATCLLQLELKGILKPLPGSRYQII